MEPHAVFVSGSCGVAVHHTEDFIFYGDSFPRSSCRCSSNSLVNNEWRATASLSADGLANKGLLLSALPQSHAQTEVDHI